MEWGLREISLRLVHLGLPSLGALTGLSPVEGVLEEFLFQARVCVWRVGGGYIQMN